MKKVCILFPEREISLQVTEAPKVLTGPGRKIRGLRVTDPQTIAFLAYVDWPNVRAVLVYDIVEQEESHGTQEG